MPPKFTDSTCVQGERKLRVRGSRKRIFFAPDRNLIWWWWWWWWWWWCSLLEVLEAEALKNMENKVKCVLYLSWLDGANRIHTNRIRKVPQTKVELWLSEEDGRMRQKDWIGGQTRALDPCMFLSISPSSSYERNPNDERHETSCSYQTETSFDDDAADEARWQD